MTDPASLPVLPEKLTIIPAARRRESADGDSEVGGGGDGLSSPPPPQSFSFHSPPAELAPMARLKGGMWGKWVGFHAPVCSSPGLRGDNDRGSGIPEAAV